MGRIGARLYEIGQWSPRLVVYDEVHGWNPLPYIGAGEFYLEYGDFDVSLTLPAGFVVAATGTVANPLVVWGPTARARLARARRSAERVQIITKAEAEANTGKRVPGTKTWRFTARNVRDFAWAAYQNPARMLTIRRGTLLRQLHRPGAPRWEVRSWKAKFPLPPDCVRWSA